MKRRTIVLCAVGAFAAAVPGAAQATTPAAAPATRLAASTLPTTTIDITRLPRGERPHLAYVVDGTIYDRDVLTPIGNDTVRSLVELDDSYVYQVPTDGTTDKSELRWVSKDGERKVLTASRRFSEPFSDGYDTAAWVRQRKVTSTGGTWLNDIYTVDNDGKVDSTHGGPSSKSPMRIVGRSTPGWVLDPQDLEPVRINDGKGLDGITYDDTIGATTASPYGDGAALAGLIKRFDSQGRPCTATAKIGVQGNKTELWRSCRLMPISYSPDAEWAVLMDSRSDGLGPSTLFIADARTGQLIRRLDVGVNQRVAWEPDGTLVLDVWTDNQMALVRCDLTDGTCERGTRIRTSPPEDHPEFLMATR